MSKPLGNEAVVCEQGKFYGCETVVQTEHVLEVQAVAKI